MPLFEYHRHTPAPEPGAEAAQRDWLNATIEAWRAEPARADAKASLLLVIPSGGLALGVGRLDGLPAAAAVFGWSAVVAALIAIGLLGAVVWPQLNGLTRDLDGAKILAAARSACDAPQVDLAEKAAEAARLRRIMFRKHRLLKAAISALGAAIVLAMVATVLA